MGYERCPGYWVMSVLGVMEYWSNGKTLFIPTNYSTPVLQYSNAPNAAKMKKKCFVFFVAINNKIA